jgi:hemoglobin
MIALTLMLAAQAVPAGEQPVDPHPASNANAGARPFADQAMWHAFHGEAGVRRIVESFASAVVADPRIAEIFKAHDPVRFRRTLYEQFCHILGGGCDYSGMDMRRAHKDMGIQTADMNAVVENLQRAMAEEGVSFFAQNRFLAKLAPMKRDVVER